MREIDNSTILVGDFNSPLVVITRQPEKKKAIRIKKTKMTLSFNLT